MMESSPPEDRRAPRAPRVSDDRTGAMDDEAELLDRLRAGDSSAIAEIYERHAPELWRFARRQVRWRDDAADVALDVVHDVFVSLARRHEVLDLRGGLRPYLFGAVRQRVLEQLRHARVVQSAEAAAGEAASGTSTRRDTPDATIERGELTAALDRALATLPDEQRIVLALRWKHHMSYDDIGRILGISATAARIRASRSQRALRAVLEKFIRE